MKIIYETELHHHGVKGMKWGVRKSGSTSGGSVNSRKKIRRIDQARIKRNNSIALKERKELYLDSKNVSAKAPKGQHIAVTGNYYQKRSGMIYTSAHIVNDLGQVKMSYINGKNGHRYIAAGRDYISKLNLNQFFKDTRNMDIEYDVYD